ncbi:MAG: hydrogenase maturation protease [Anaerolineales bacterium]
MARPLVIGYGNTLCGDDGFGPVVADALREVCADADILTLHQLTPEYAEAVAGAACVIFVDICVDGPTGQLECTALAPDETGQSATHHMTPAGLLRWADALYGPPPPAHLIMVAGVDFSLGAGLSETVAAQVGPAVEAIRGLLAPA